MVSDDLSKYTLGIKKFTYGVLDKNGYGRIEICRSKADSCIYQSSEFLWDSNVTEPVTLNLDDTDGRSLAI